MGTCEWNKQQESEQPLSASVNIRTLHIRIAMFFHHITQVRRVAARLLSLVAIPLGSGAEAQLMAALCLKLRDKDEGVQAAVHALIVQVWLCLSESVFKTLVV